MLSCVFFINSRIITFLFSASGLTENCVLSTWQRNHELAILLSPQLAIRISLVADVLESIWPPVSALCPESGGGAAAPKYFLQERNSDCKTPLGVP